jgi:DNA-binding beta-propeller fold protein YncE
VKPGRGHRVSAAIISLLLTALFIAGWGGNALAGAFDRSEIERRLALPPFAYVGETDHDKAQLQKGEFVYSGAVAFIDSQSDTLVARPAGGASLQGVAVAPDGSRFYMTDAYEPVLHVFDAETELEIAEVTLPGVEARDPMFMVKAFQDAAGTFPYSLMRSCASGLACTPDGSLVLVASSVGLLVVDAATNKVVRTLPDLLGGSVAVSFDGKRAYADDDDFDELDPRSFADWFKLISTTEDCRLVCVDLETWQIVEETSCALVASIAVKPDDSQVFFSETYKKQVRVVDAFILEDLWTVSTEPSFSIGIGFVPNGTKAYVVCNADNGTLAYFAGSSPTAIRQPTAEEYFCGVIDTAKKEIVKRIPLEAY